MPKFMVLPRLPRYSVIKQFGAEPWYVYDHEEQREVTRFRFKRSANRHAAYLNERDK